jgi:hypothetical protein
MTDDRKAPPDQHLLFTDALGRKPQARWVSAAQARADARAHFDGLPAGVRTATIEHLHRMLADASWRHAVTMPENPHQYSHSRTWLNRAAFTFAVEYIRMLGVRERFHGRLYTVYFCGGFKHWTMNWPTSQTILINRKPESAPPSGDEPSPPPALDVPAGTRRITLDEETDE